MFAAFVCSFTIQISIHNTLLINTTFICIKYKRSEWQSQRVRKASKVTRRGKGNMMPSTNKLALCLSLSFSLSFCFILKITWSTAPKLTIWSKGGWHERTKEGTCTFVVQLQWNEWYLQLSTNTKACDNKQINKYGEKQSYRGNITINTAPLLAVCCSLLDAASSCYSVFSSVSLFDGERASRRDTKIMW